MTKRNKRIQAKSPKSKQATAPSGQRVAKACQFESSTISREEFADSNESVGLSGRKKCGQEVDEGRQRFAKEP